MFFYFRFKTFLILSLLVSKTWAEVGVSKKEILVGTATNLKGATPGVAEEFNAGLTAYFNKINKAGGIYGRHIRRIIYNDSYEPEKTVVETKKLISQDKVFALIGFASTPGTHAILPLVNKNKIPVIAPYSGIDAFRDPKQKYVFNIKAGYPDQAESLIKMSVYSLGVKDVCVFYQDDLLGNSGRLGAENTLKQYNLKVLAQASYVRKSMDIDGALKTLKEANCKAILMASQDRQAAHFVKMANKADFHPIYLCLNLIGTSEFLTQVKSLGEKIYVAITTPLPTETAYPIVKEFRSEVVDLNPEAKINSNTLEGYLVGSVFEYVLRKAGKKLTRKKLIKSFENLKNVTIGGVNFSFNKANRQATNRVLITRAEEGDLVLLP